MRGVPSWFVSVRTNILRQDASFYIDLFLTLSQRITQIAPGGNGVLWYLSDTQNTVRDVAKYGSTTTGTQATVRNYSGSWGHPFFESNF